MLKTMQKLILLIWILFVSCQNQCDKCAFKMNFGKEPQSVDPRKVRTLQDICLCQMIFEGLMREAKQEKSELALAEKIEISKDNKIYTFYLKNSKWSNGKDVTSYDFAYSWKTALSCDFPSAFAYQLYAIKGAKEAKEGKIGIDEIGIQTPDEKTLIVELHTPVPYFLEQLCLPIFFPVCKELDQANPNWPNEAISIVSNGAFMMKNWKHDEKIELKKNPYYFDKSVQLDNVHLIMVSPETEFQMFQAKELDWVGSPLSSLPIDIIDELALKNKVLSEPFLATAFLRINTTNPTMKHSFLRQALAYSIERQELVDHILKGNHKIATSLVPSSLGMQEFSKYQNCNKQLAIEMLHKTQMDSTASISLMYVKSENSHLIAQTLQQGWQNVLGITVKLDATESKTYFHRLRNKDYQMALSNWVADINDPINFLEIFQYADRGSNHTGWQHPEYIDKIDQSNLASNEKRKELLNQAQRILMDEMPIIPLYHLSLLYMKKDHVKDVRISSLGHIDLKYAHIDTEDKR